MIKKTIVGIIILLNFASLLLTLIGYSLGVILLLIHKIKIGLFLLGIGGLGTIWIFTAGLKLAKVGYRLLYFQNRKQNENK
jgi:hypothetical protein